MDSFDNENFNCNGDLECENSKPSTTDDDISLELIDVNESESKIENIQNFSSGFGDLDLKVPMTIQNCTPNGMHVSSELVVITNTGASFLNDQSVKIPLASIHTLDASEPIGKRLCLEQDVQTYILTLPGGMDGLTGIVELSDKNLTAVDASQILGNPEKVKNSSKQGINQNWFTSRADKTTLHNKGHIWKQGMWSKEEVELLENNIRQYCEDHDVSDPATIIFETSKDERKDFYRTIAKGLNRPLFSVYRRVIRMYDNKNHVGKYTPEELEKLKQLRSVYGNDWQAIGAAMGRSASSIKDRCRLMKDNCNQGKWLQAEERRLADAVYELTKALPGEMVSTGLSWAMVAERVGTRSEKQCRTKWLNYLNWKEAGGTEWTRDDDVSLICRVCALNATDENQVDWMELAKGWLSVRSPQWLRGKWWSLKRHVPNSNVVSFQEVCDFLYQQFVLKIHVKEEICSVNENSSDITLQSTPLVTRPKPTIIRSLAVSTTPSPASIVVRGDTQACTPVVSLTNTDSIELRNSANDLSSVHMSPMLQTLEILPQNVQLAPNPQTFLLATHPQQTLPLATPVSPSQIIIHTVTADGLQRNENVTVQMNTPPQIVINASNPTALTSLASTQIPSAPPSPPDVEQDSLEDAHSGLLEDNHFETQVIEENGNIHNVSHLEDEQDSICKNNSSSQFILADPMLAASHSPDPVASDVESEKVADETLDQGSASEC